ncbi:hypothetical protein [Devosia sp. CN2-171]|jgi:hypothetical protein|uniref:hypothetical protein n=1 Tax=Devosia sp. CN2-171 TaxID=3400909 RepID=UPI003BF7A8DF
MSEFEDRQDATPAIDTPATSAAAPLPAGAASPDTAPDSVDIAALVEASMSDEDDLEAVAAVEGSGDFSRDDASAADEEPVSVAEASAPRELPPAYPEVSDAVAAPGDDVPLLDDALEDGIASVFAALHAAARDGEIGESDEPAGPLSDDEATDGITFRLLGELDRLWHRAA